MVGVRVYGWESGVLGGGQRVRGPVDGGQRVRGPGVVEV